MVLHLQAWLERKVQSLVEVARRLSHTVVAVRIEKMHKTYGFKQIQRNTSAIIDYYCFISECPVTNPDILAIRVISVQIFS